MSDLGHSQQRQRAPKIHRCPLCSESDGQPSKRDLSQWAKRRPSASQQDGPLFNYLVGGGKKRLVSYLFHVSASAGSGWDAGDRGWRSPTERHIAVYSHLIPRKRRKNGHLNIPTRRAVSDQKKTEHDRR